MLGSTTLREKGRADEGDRSCSRARLVREVEDGSATEDHEKLGRETQEELTVDKEKVK